jgi:hypothetical protein
LEALGDLPHKGVRRAGNSRNTIAANRPRHDSRTVTAQHAEVSIEDVWVLAMALADGTDSTETQAVLSKAKEALDGFPLVVRSVEETLVAMFKPEAPNDGRATVAAGAARVLRESLPDLPIVVTSGNSASVVLDRAATMLQALELKAMFGAAGAALPIHLDSTAAKKLEKSFQIERDGEHFILGHDGVGAAEQP